MLKKFLALVCFLVLLSCENTSETEQKIAQIPVEVEVVRFDEQFAEATPESLPELKKEFPFLFPEGISDSVWVEKINDTLQQALNREVAKAFPNLEEEKDEFRQLFQHLKYYFPKFSAPKIITLTSDVDYRNRVIVTDSLLLISLDVYLGKDHEFYGGIYDYIRKDFEPELLVSDIAGEYAKNFVPYPTSRSFLAQMVYYGKILYLKDLLIPFKSDPQKIRYTEKQLEWAKDNEEQIWRYFVENELLFKTDPDLKSRFIDLAPFSKFYLQLDSESPPQLGRYIGWQIVRQFVERNETVSWEKLLQTDAKTIFDQSNYKPRK
ncbi:MAG TPA: gliding motility lipoprotein GldB [Flavobacteriaceae bacterium]|nr:gliding motility lipoprotein GldB [Flavobacteriaceae bacterium]